jgi:hypothetical protein
MYQEAYFTLISQDRSNGFQDFISVRRRYGISPNGMEGCRQVRESAEGCIHFRPEGAPVPVDRDHGYALFKELSNGCQA